MLKGEEQNTFLLCNVQGCLLQKPGACSPGKQYCTLVESATIDGQPGERIIGLCSKITTHPTGLTTLHIPLAVSFHWCGPRWRMA